MTNWKDIHLDFNYHGWDWETNYQQEWESNGFTYLQTKEWIDIGMKPQDALFCTYLRDIKKLEPIQVLNFGNVKQLRKEYQNKEAIHLKELETALEEARKEIDQLNITLLQQQKISSQVSKTKKELIEDYNLLEKENEKLKSSLNNLNNLQSENQRLLQANSYLQIRVNYLTHLINQKQPSSSLIINWLTKNKQPLLIIGTITIFGYLLLKE